MDKFYNITEVKFTNEFMYFKVDNLQYTIVVSEVSAKLAEASDIIRNDFKISPSGYGIHWNQIDEDLSINGLLRIAKAKNTATN